MAITVATSLASNVRRTFNGLHLENLLQSSNVYTDEREEFFIIVHNTKNIFLATVVNMFQKLVKFTIIWRRSIKILLQYLSLIT